METNTLTISDDMLLEYSLSIVVPCYNCKDTLDRTVDSLVSQIIKEKVDASRYQILLINDGSTDITPQKCDEYANKYSNITVIHKSNGGLVDAWKTGVRNAKGTYIAFCDSDDYIEQDFVQTISKAIADYQPDMITFGMTYEYDNGEIVREDTRLEAGDFDRSDIESKIFPSLLSDGDMQSELIGSSRCNKVFRKSLLDRVLDDIPESVSFGEDDITSFASVLNASSLYSIKGFYPYHYVRNTESMIGAYDEKAFEKIDILYKELSRISGKYDYNYNDQVEKGILSILFLYIKKEICKNPSGYKNVHARVLNVVEGETFIACYKSESIKKYGMAKKVFASLISNKRIFLAYILSKGVEKVRGRNV